MITRRDLILHVIIGFFAVLTLVPFLFTLNNAWRTNAEMFRSFFGLPESLTQMVEAKRAQWAGVDAQFEVETDEGEVITVGAAEAGGYLLLIETSMLPGYASARRLYESAGYQREAVIRDFYARGDDLVLFSKRLD